jgi:hypothetical protein
MNLGNENLEVLENQQKQNDKNPFKPTGTFIGIS